LRQEYLASVSAAIKIATCWRRFHCKSEYSKVVAGTSFHAVRVGSSTNYCAHNDCILICFSDVIVCQSVVRRCIAVAQAGNMRHERSVAAATKIQAMWRCFNAMDLYFETVMDVVLVQSVARRLLSTRLFAQMKEDKRLLENTAAVKIASMWRGFVCLREYKQSVRGMSALTSLSF